jgi:hypothetical protein
MSIYELAYAEEYKEVKEAVKDSRDANMAIMGFCSKQTELLNGADITRSKEEYKKLDEATQKRVKMLEKHIWWCVGEGACLIFGFQHPARDRPKDDTKRSAFFDRARMLKKGAPGEVVRGTFKKD